MSSWWFKLYVTRRDGKTGLWIKGQKITSNFLKAVFHKFHFVHSLLCPMCYILILILHRGKNWWLITSNFPLCWTINIAELRIHTFFQFPEIFFTKAGFRKYSVQKQFILFPEETLQTDAGCYSKTCDSMFVFWYVSM